MYYLCTMYFKKGSVDVEEKRGRSTTQTIRMTEDVQAELKELIDAHQDGTAGDVIEMIIRAYKANSVATGIAENDLRELNALTSRMYSLYENILERNQVSMIRVKDEFNSKLLEAEDKIKDIQGVLQVKEENLKSLEAKLERQISEYQKLHKENVRLKEMESKNDELIKQLKDKVANYEELKTENSNLRTMYDGLESDYNKAVLDKDSAIRELEVLGQELEKLKLSHKEELGIIRERAKLDVEKSIADIEKVHRAILDEKEDKILELKNEIADIINNFSVESNGLRVELSQLKDKIRELEAVRVNSEELRNS